MENFLGIFTSFGLSTSAGLNAYLPMLIVALVAKFTKLISLNEPFDLLTNWWVIGVLVVLLSIEIFADKVPAVDTINDVVQTFVRPTAGAILFAANANTIADVSPILAMICGLLLAGTVHVVKATARPAVTASTAGVGNPVVSTVEDVISGVTALLSILLPTLVAIVLLLATLIIGWWLWKRHQARQNML
ncbi:MAG: DUF4126 domain-containing protein [Anaerolineae bacterium]|nr:DUF4126 domain-containing protein [Anaerolineae bacterium]